MNPQINENDNIDINNINNMNNNINANNNANNNNNNTGSKIILGIISFVTIIISFSNIYNFIHIVNLIKKAYNQLPFEVFEECFLYQKFSDLFIEFLSIFLGIDLIFLIVLPFVEYNFDIEAFIFIFGKSFVYMNYLVFGPFLIGCFLLSLKYSNKIMYICVNYDPQRKILDYRLLFVFLFSMTIAFLLTFFGTYFFEIEFFQNSIIFKSSGNYIIGNIFWSYAVRNSNHLRNRNVLNERILDHGSNIQKENQNLNP